MQLTVGSKEIIIVAMTNETGSGESNTDGPQEPINILPGQKGVIPRPGVVDRIQQWNLNRRRLSRRETIGAAGVGIVTAVTGATGLAAAYESQKKPSSEQKLMPVPETTPVAEIDKYHQIIHVGKEVQGDQVRYFQSDVAQYLELDLLHTATNYDPKKDNFEPRMHDVSLEEKFDPEQFSEQFRVIADRDKLPENVCLVRVGIKAYNDNPVRRIRTDNDLTDPENVVYVWLALADRNSPDPYNPIWVDENGQPTSGKIVVFSPIYGDTQPLKKKE